MTPQAAVLRVKKSVWPSGAKVGEPSLAGPEITPGAKICGETATVAPLPAGVVGEFDCPRAMGAQIRRHSSQQVLFPVTKASSKLAANSWIGPTLAFGLRFAPQVSGVAIFPDAPADDTQLRFRRIGQHGKKLE